MADAFGDLTGGGAEIGLSAITSGTVPEQAVVMSNAIGTPNGYPVDGGVIMTAPGNDVFGGLAAGLSRWADTAVHVADAYTTLHNAISPPKKSPQAVPTQYLQNTHKPWYQENQTLLIGGGIVALVLIIALTR